MEAHGTHWLTRGAEPDPPHEIVSLSLVSEKMQNVGQISYCFEILATIWPHVYICGLDGDFKRKPFGNWLDLIPLCDKVTKLTAYCKLCKKRDAIFSHRLGYEESQTVIGNNYMSLCRECYNKLNS